MARRLGSIAFLVAGIGIILYFATSLVVIAPAITQFGNPGMIRSYWLVNGFWFALGGGLIYLWYFIAKRI